MVQLSVSQGLTTAKPLEWKQIFKVFQKPAYFMELLVEHIYHGAELMESSQSRTNNIHAFSSHTQLYLQLQLALPEFCLTVSSNYF